MQQPQSDRVMLSDAVIKGKCNLQLQREPAENDFGVI